MEVIFTAILGEVANRSLSFLIAKCSEETASSVEEMLQRLLLRVRAIVEEAEERSIENQAMIQQLNMLRKEMYKGYYVLDSFRGNQNREEKGHSVRRSFAFSRFVHVKRRFLSTADGKPCVNELENVSRNLRGIVFDMEEFITFLKHYPTRYHQPYSMHLILDKCMFGRQNEMERIVNFLMQPSNGKSIEVLPIIGPAGVGKSTLIAHVYNCEKVRDHFSRIVLVTQDDLKDRPLTRLEDGGMTIHQINPSNCGNGRLLVIIELSKDVEESTWKRLYVASGCLESGSKIMVTSRSSKVASVGTTQALVLNTLPIEAFWYFFKVLTFGSADPEDQPKLQCIAIQIAKEMNGSFAEASVVSSFLRNNLNAQHWCMVLASIRAHARRKMSLSVKRVGNLVPRNKPAYIFRMDRSFRFMLYDLYQSKFPHDKVPKVTLHDVIAGHAKHQGRFEVLAWKSRIPPYTSYIISCEVRKSQKN